MCYGVAGSHIGELQSHANYRTIYDNRMQKTQSKAKRQNPIVYTSENPFDKQNSIAVFCAQVTIAVHQRQMPS